MRSLSRLLVLGTLSALAITAPSAMAANTMTATVSPNKGGTTVVGTPLSFKLAAQFPDRHSDTSGNTILQAIDAKLPPSLLFNTIPFGTCQGDALLQTGFFATGVCPAATKLGSAVVIADGGPSLGDITATTNLYFGQGFQVFATVVSTAPAQINEKIAASLQSSGSAAYGLTLHIPISIHIQQPITGVYPTVKSITTTFASQSKKVKIKGLGKVVVPLTGLGPCPASKKLPFELDIKYTNAIGTDTPTTATDVATASGTCK